MWYAELFVGRDDCDWDYLRCVYREDAGDYECGAGFVKRGSHIVYYDDGRYVLLGWDDGNCIGSRGGEKYVPQDAAGNPISISGYSGKSPIYGAYYDKYYCQCTGAWVGGDACRALSYYNDRLKNPLRNQGFPPNLVLMKKCSFASKHF